MSEYLDVVNPADTRLKVGRVEASTPAGARDALERATSAQRGWGRLDPTERGAVLFELSRLLRRDAHDLALLITREMGKLLSDAAKEVESAARFAEYYAGIGYAAFGDVLPGGRAGVSASAFRAPVGVVLLITPWNDPLVTPLRKAAPALIMGNAVLLKPASISPLIAVRLEALLLEAGLPSGVLQVLAGRPPMTVDPLLDDDRLSAVSFTGSTAAGLQLRSRLAARNVRLLTEMGGKNAAIVLADADVDLAAATIVAAAFGQSGQRCTATSRVLVHESVADAVRERLAASIDETVVGDPESSASLMGPLASESARESTLASLARARAVGSSVHGGRSLDDGALSHGWFFEPAMVDVRDDGDPTWTDELFAPVVAIRTFGSADEAIALANATRYGLSASVFTNDLSAAHRFIAELNVGQVAVNLPSSGWPVFLPFGGWGDSGSAHKEQGEQVLDFYSRWKTAAIATPSYR